MAAVTAAILVKLAIIWSVSDRDDRDTPADCRRYAWLAARAAAGCSAPSSVQPQVLQGGKETAVPAFGAREDGGICHWSV